MTLREFREATASMPEDIELVAVDDDGNTVLVGDACLEDGLLCIYGESDQDEEEPDEDDSEEEDEEEDDE